MTKFYHEQQTCGLNGPLDEKSELARLRADRDALAAALQKIADGDATLWTHMHGRVTLEPGRWARIALTALKQHGGQS